MTDCAIVGGGVAGLSAAVRLASRGVRVALFEARPRAGGRAFAFLDRESGSMVDNGQHIIMGCYTAMLEYLDTIGTREKLAPVRNMRVPFLAPGGRRSVLKAAPLPWPLDALSAFLCYDALSFSDRIGLLTVAVRAATMKRRSMRKLDSRTVEQWLHRCGQSTEAIAYLWEPIVLATMNAKISEASAYLFAVILKDAFLSGKEASTFLVPGTDLSSLLVDPALEFIKNNGGTVQLHTAVGRIETADGHFVLETGGGSHSATSAVLAVPPRAYAALAESSPAIQNLSIETGRYIPSQIISAHIWSHTEITAELMTGFHDCTLQWLFPRGNESGGLFRYAAVISAANELRAVSNEELRKTVGEELRGVYSHLTGADIARIKLVREADATFLPSPGLEFRRPAVDAAGNGLYIAGDWTAVSLPATLEGAVRSGHRAAAAVEAHLRESRPKDNSA